MSSSLLASFLIPTIAAAVLAQSCGGGEMPGTNSNGSSGGSGSGGNLTSPSSGGSTFTSGTGSGSGSGTGGSSSTGSGGSTIIMGATGGASSSGNGGTTLITGLASGGSTLITGATGGSTVMGTPGSLMAMAGFATNGTWMGYAFTTTFGTTATITPACPTPCFAGTTTLCAMGTVGGDPTYNSGAALGWSINQKATSTAVGLLTPSATGGLSITVSAVVPGARVSIKDAATPKPNEWCANLISTTATVPWSMFNTTCWNPSLGKAYAGEPIAAVQVVVPAMAATPVPFNFCLVDAHQY
jgi:hypothetical protein